MFYSQGVQAYCPYQHCPYPNTYNWHTCKCEPRPKCRPFACPFPKELNFATCRCICPFELSRFCSRGERFDANTCQCVSICPFRNTRCNQFQEFNRDTCRCECVEVVPARRRFRDRTDDDNGRRGTDSKRSASDSSDTTGCPEGSDSDSSDSSDSTTGKRCPPARVETTRFCPSGQRLNRRTCRCFIVTRRRFRVRDRTDDDRRRGGSDSS